MRLQRNDQHDIQACNQTRAVQDRPFRNLTIVNEVSVSREYADHDGILAEGRFRMACLSSILTVLDNPAAAAFPAGHYGTRLQSLEDQTLRPSIGVADDHRYTPAMSSSVVIILAVLFFVAAALYASVGHAGASGYLAVMALVGVSPAVMKPTALVLNIVVAAIASLLYGRAGAFSWRTFWPFAVTSVPASFIGGRLVVPARGAVRWGSHLYLAHHLQELRLARGEIFVKLGFHALLGEVAGGEPGSHLHLAHHLQEK